MTDSSTLDNALSQCDASSADELSLIYARFHDDKKFVGNLLSLLASPQTELATSWLIKRYLEDGGTLSDKQVKKLVKMANDFKHWPSTLHFLQSLPMLTIPGDVSEKLHAYLMQKLQEKNKFIRAWAYGGFHILGQQHENFRSEAEAILDLAMQDEAPAVKARIRRLRNG